MDSQAVYSNKQMRSSDFRWLIGQAIQYHEIWLDRLKTLRTFYLRVAEARLEETVPHDGIVTIDDHDWDLTAGYLPLADQLPIDWQRKIPALTGKLPRSFIILVVELIEQLDESECSFVPLSYIELALLFLRSPSFSIPSHTDDVQTLARVTTFYTRPTLSHIVGLLKTAFRFVVRTFELDHLCVKQANRSDISIHHHTEAFLCRLGPASIGWIRQMIDSFSHGRGIRKAADIARPIPS